MKREHRSCDRTTLLEGTPGQDELQSSHSRENRKKEPEVYMNVQGIFHRRQEKKRETVGVIPRKNSPLSLSPKTNA
jgi:hypothetical protein